MTTKVLPGADVRPLQSDLAERIATVGQRLAENIQRVVDGMPGGPFRPQQLARVLGVSKDLSSRILAACRKQDPLAATHLMPGPQPLREFLRAAVRRGVAPELISAAEEAVLDFDKLIQVEAGDRAGLDTLIGAWLPEARERVQAAAKQAMFRGAATLKGIVCETFLGTWLAHPAAETPEAECDCAFLTGLLGLRRTRLRAVAQWTSLSHERRLHAARPGPPAETIPGMLLPQFCSASAELVARMEGDRIHYTLAGEAAGLKSAVDVCFAESLPRSQPRFRGPARPGKRYFYCGLHQPARMLVFDMLLHEDVWPGKEPELYLYDTTINGLADPNNPARDVDRLNLVESLQFIGKGLSRFHASEVPRYVEMLRYLCDQRGWNGDQFRAFRCRIQHPFYGCQVCMLFDPPPEPE